MQLTQLPLTHICDYTVDLAPVMPMGAGRAGDRRIIPIIGGQVTGPRLMGRLLHLGRIGRPCLRMVWRNLTRVMR